MCVQWIMEKYIKKNFISQDFLKFIFNWKLIALQCYVCFCHTAKSAMSIYMFLPSWTSLPLPIASHPSRLSRSTRLSSLVYMLTSHWVDLPVLHSSFPLAVCFMCSNAYVSVLPSQFIPLSPSPSVSTSLFPRSASIPALQVGSSVPFL